MYTSRNNNLSAVNYVKSISSFNFIYNVNFDRTCCELQVKISNNNDDTGYFRIRKFVQFIEGFKILLLIKCTHMKNCMSCRNKNGIMFIVRGLVKTENCCNFQWWKSTRQAVGCSPRSNRSGTGEDCRTAKEFPWETLMERSVQNLEKIKFVVFG